MASSREKVCRDLKKRERLFLNYESQKKVALGDIIIWSGWKAEFNVVTRLSDLGIKCRSQTSAVKSTKLYCSKSGVTMGFNASGRTGNPTMEFRYRGASRYSLQAFDTKFKSIDEVDLAACITKEIDFGNLVWNKHWIVVSSVWNANSYTQLVAGGKCAEADICAAPGSVADAFNIADTSIGVNLGYGDQLCSQEVADAGACPFFIGMKYRQQQDAIPYMARYGG